MITTPLIMLCAFVWVFILLHQMTQRGFAVLLLWLFIAPVASNVVEHPTRNPFFPPAQEDEPIFETRGHQKSRSERGYFADETSIRAQELLEPTRLLFVAFFVLFLLQAILRKRPLVQLDRTERCMAIFLCIAIVNVVLWSDRVANGLRVISDAFAIPFLGYFLSRRFVTDEVNFRKLIRILSLLGCFLIAICLFEATLHAGRLHRVQGPFSTRDYLYVVIMVIFFLTAVEFARQWFGRVRGGVSTVIQLTILGFAPVIVLLTLTRGNWLGFLCGVWVFVFMGRKLLPTRRKVLIFGLVLSLVPLAFLGVQSLIQEDNISERLNNSSTMSSRMATYAIVVEEALSSPVFGIGLNNLRHALAKRVSFVEGVGNLGTAHQSYLAMWAELGSVGLFAYFAIMVSLWKLGLRISRSSSFAEDRWRGIGALAIMIAYWLPALFSNLLFYQMLIHVYVFVCLGALAGRYPQRPFLPRSLPWSPRRAAKPYSVSA